MILRFSVLMRLIRFALLALLLFPVASSGQLEQPGEIIVIQDNGTVRFRFLAYEVGSRRLYPAEATALDVRPEDQTQPVWSVGADRGRFGASEIVYGRLPTGFIQYVPEIEPPPALIPGKKYILGGVVKGFAVGTFIYQPRGPH